MRRISIFTKLMGAFAAVVVVASIGAVLPVNALREGDQRFASVFADRVVPLHQLGSILQRVEQATSQALGSGTMDRAASTQSLKGEVDSLWKAYLATYLTPEETVLAERAKAPVAAWLAAIPLGGKAVESAAAADVSAKQIAIAPIFRDLMDLQVRVAQEELAASRETSRRATQFALFVLLAVAGAALFTAWYFSRGLVQGLASIQQRATSLSSHCIAELTAGLQALTRGDASILVEPATTPITWTRNDELGELATTVNQMVGEIRQSVESYNSMRCVVRTLADDVRTVGESILAGDVDRRMDADVYHGAFRESATSVNKALTGVLEPMTVAMASLRSGIAALAVGDLRFRPNADGAGCHASLLTDFGDAIAQLESTVASVKAATSEVSSASREIASAAEQGANGAAQQAANLEEVAAGTSEIRSGARRITDEAEEGRRVTLAVSSATGIGTTELQALAVALATMKDRAEATSRVVKAIDEISFQTNLLALNAAVEAARAGDAGRSFAVVADEVRALALRAAESARRASSLIEENVSAVAAGVAAGERAIGGISGIEKHVTALSAIMETVTGRCTLQLQHIDQISEVVDSLNGITQQSAASAEETAAASEELRGQSASLNELMQEFTVDGVGGATPGRNVPANTARRRPSRTPEYATR